jgi:hypothetical protein
MFRAGSHVRFSHWHASFATQFRHDYAREKQAFGNCAPIVSETLVSRTIEDDAISSASDEISSVLV